MNFVFISPNFPKIFSHFVKALNDRGITVLGIGDERFENLNDELKSNLKEYCFVSDLSNLQWLKNTLDYLEAKYGHLDFIESNNEFWLMSDSYLREYKNVTTGFWPKDMEKIKYKSSMKKYFAKAGVKTARYILVKDFNEIEKFCNEVGYPVFAKPDNGVGAAQTYKISNHDELVHFWNTKPYELYIMEEFIDGELMSFDGICDSNSNVLLAFNEIFPIPIAEAVNKGTDMHYYAKLKMDDEFRKLGTATVKVFGISKRCFHIEYFKLKKDKPGLGKKGDILGLEVNMRSPGGDTPDLLCIALNASYYECYADVIAYNEIRTNIDVPHFYAASVSKKYKFNYVHSNDEIFTKYGDKIVRHGFYDPAIAEAMGNEFFFAKFTNIKDVKEFIDFSLSKK